MTIRTILTTITFGLLVWLLIDSMFQLDIAATKNDGLINSEKMKVESFQNIDSVKVYAKSKLDVIRQNTKRNSVIATKRIWVIIGLIVLQMFLLSNASRKKSV
ncbi:MAG: hypothetical protein ABI405_04310 [Parafilimonas sp.]